MWATLSIASLPSIEAWYLWVLNAGIGLFLLAEELGGFAQVMLLTLVVGFGIEAWERHHHEPQPHTHHEAKLQVARRCAGLMAKCDLDTDIHGGRL